MMKVLKGSTEEMKLEIKKLLRKSDMCSKCGSKFVITAVEEYEKSTKMFAKCANHTCGVKWGFSIHAIPKAELLLNGFACLAEL